MKSSAVFETLTKIKPGDTLCSDLTIVEHGTWFSFLKRSLSGDTRSITVQIIEDAVNGYCEDKKVVKYLKTKEIASLEETRTGIKNLIETYSQDKLVQNRLKSCHLSLRAFITSKWERSSSSDEDQEGQRNPFISKEEEFEIEEEEEEIEEIESQDKAVELCDSQIVNSNCEGEVSAKKSLCEDEKSTDYVPGAKFEKYLKKKKPRGRYDGRRIFGDSGISIHTRDVNTIRRLPKLHVITMGDVLSKVDLLPSTLSNPLFSSVSQMAKTRDVTWYVENFLKK